MGIISKFGSWIFRMFVPKVPHIQLPRPGVSPAKPAIQESLTAREGAVLVKEDGVAVLYPPVGTVGVEERVIDTLDYLRHALQRSDWMAEWYADKEFEAFDEEDEPPPPILTVLDGGRVNEPQELEPGPFAPKVVKDPPLSE